MKIDEKPESGEGNMAESANRGGNRPAEILLEVQPRSVSGDLAPRVSVPEDFHQRADEIAQSIARAADQFRARIADIIRHPTDNDWGIDSIEIGFDIAVQAETGVVIAKASTGATFTARLTIKAPGEGR